MRQLAIIVQSHGLDVALVIFVQFDFMLYHFDTGFKDTFIFDSLSDLELPSMCAGWLLRVTIITFVTLIELTLRNTLRSLTQKDLFWSGSLLGSTLIWSPRSDIVVSLILLLSAIHIDIL